MRTIHTMVSVFPSRVNVCMDVHPTACSDEEHALSEREGDTDFIDDVAQADSGNMHQTMFVRMAVSEGKNGNVSLPFVRKDDEHTDDEPELDYDFDRDNGPVQVELPVIPRYVPSRSWCPFFLLG